MFSFLTAIYQLVMFVLGIGFLVGIAVYVIRKTRNKS